MVSSATSLDRTVQTGPPSDVAMVDWDDLFRAVQARLRSLGGDPPDAAAPASRPRASAKRISAGIRECMGALEQLHTTLVNEIERRRLLEQEVLDGRGALTRLLADRAGIRDPERDALRPASHDSLTSLPNRDHFRDRLDRAMVRAEERREALAVLYLDLDVAIPAEERGDAEPDDQLLRIVAARLTGMVRAEDTLGRVGGDEFACMLVNAPGRELLSHLACKLLRAVSAPMTIGEATLSVRPSIGIAIGPDDGATAETLLEIADAAMQRAKWQRTGYAFCDTRAEVWARQFVRF